MVIHVVAPGDTLFSIAEAYGVPFSLLAIDNGLSTPYQLAVGQALVVQFPRLAHTVRPGETTSASDICAHFGGGGHARAAGCQFEGLSPEEIREKMVKAAYGEMGRG